MTKKAMKIPTMMVGQNYLKRQVRVQRISGILKVYGKFQILLQNFSFFSNMPISVQVIAHAYEDEKALAKIVIKPSK